MSSTEVEQVKQVEEVKQLDDKDQIKLATIDVENIYDEIEIDDMELNEDDEGNHIFQYPCPCGDKFRITLK